MFFEQETFFFLQMMGGMGRGGQKKFVGGFKWRETPPFGQGDSAKFKWREDNEEVLHIFP